MLYRHVQVACYHSQFPLWFLELEMELCTPLCHIHYRYSLSNIDAWQAAQLTVTPGSESGEPVVNCSNEVTTETTIPYMTWVMGIGQTISSQACLRGGRSYDVVLAIMQSGSALDSADVQFLIDSLVVLPVGVADLQVFQDNPALLPLYSSCLEVRSSVITRVTEPEGCRDLVFSVTTEIFNGTLGKQTDVPMLGLLNYNVIHYVY